MTLHLKITGATIGMRLGRISGSSWFWFMTQTKWTRINIVTNASLSISNAHWHSLDYMNLILFQMNTVYSCTITWKLCFNHRWKMVNQIHNRTSKKIRRTWKSFVATTLMKSNLTPPLQIISSNYSAFSSWCPNLPVLNVDMLFTTPEGDNLHRSSGCLEYPNRLRWCRSKLLRISPEILLDFCWESSGRMPKRVLTWAASPNTPTVSLGFKKTCVNLSIGVICNKFYKLCKCNLVYCLA